MKTKALITIGSLIVFFSYLYFNYGWIRESTYNEYGQTEEKFLGKEYLDADIPYVYNFEGGIKNTFIIEALNTEAELTLIGQSGDSSTVNSRRNVIEVDDLYVTVISSENTTVHASLGSTLKKLKK